VSLSLSASRLEALLESADLLHSSLDAADLARHLLRSAMGRLVATRGVVTLRARDGERVVVSRGVKSLPAGEAFDDAQARAAGLRVFIPIGDAAAALGTLALSAPPTGTVDPTEEEFLRALAGLAASGMSNAQAHAQVKQLNTRLDLKVQQLQTLLDLARALTRADGPDEIAQLLALTLAGQWAASRYVVAAQRAGHPTVVRQKQVELAWSLEEHLRELTTLPEAVRVEMVPAGPLREMLQGQRLTAIFPLRSAAGTFGLAAVGARPGGGYGDADLALGAGLVAQAAVAFENTWQLRELLEKKQIERELTLAASIQQTLFPAVLPQLRDGDLAAMNRPARQVGGDYYDALAFDAQEPVDRCVLCVADVSGKGIAASLLMSNMQATLRALLGREASLAELARCTNELLFASTPGNKYVTAFLLSLDLTTGTCAYVNGGHTAGLLLRADGSVEWLTSTGLALGMFPGARYDEGSLTLGPGDLIALYSDGVTEAVNDRDEEFGTERLVAVLRHSASIPAQEIVARIVAAVEHFTAGAPQFDDITLLVVKRTDRLTANGPRPANGGP
jgi:sigma-B regulation protein RsbU (phosphoserine phosphatase)